MDGGGTVFFTNNNTYTGATTVSSGTLLISGALGATNVTVEDFAGFGGTGTVGGNIDFDVGSILMVSNLANPLTVSGTVTFGEYGMLGSSLEWNGKRRRSIGRAFWPPIRRVTAPLFCVGVRRHHA